MNEKILSLDSWYVGIGASYQICWNRDLFEDREEHEGAILLAGDYRMIAKGNGIVRSATQKLNVAFIDVLYARNLQCSFFGCSQGNESGIYCPVHKNWLKHRRQTRWNHFT